MVIRFLHHSCFSVELDDRVLLFDYFDGNRIEGYHFTGVLPEYEPGTRFYIFASHSHRDHYDMDVLRLKERYQVHYIFAKDIRVSPNFLKKHGIDPEVRKQITFVTAGEHRFLDDMDITTYRSTDQGVAYLVRYHGVTLFHAGDLNDWQYEGAGELVNGIMRSNFRSQIRKLSKEQLHVAFFPLDPRLKEHAADGFRYFLEHVSCDLVFPMHQWRDYSGTKELKKCITNQHMCDKIMEISQENQEFFINVQD